MLRNLAVSQSTRRDLLKAAAIGGGVAGARVLAPYRARRVDAQGDPLKIGVLVPTSGVYAALGESIIDGMELYFAGVANTAGGREVELITEDEGSAPDVALQKARKLIEQDEVDLVAGIVSSGIALALHNYFEENEKFLIIANAGAAALTRDRRSPFIYRTSFTNWQPAWPMGAWAFENLGTRALISASDYAAGHEVVSAFRHGFEGAGGEVLNVQLTPFPNPGDLAPFMAEIRATEPDFVYAFYAGTAAVSFVGTTPTSA